MVYTLIRKGTAMTERCLIAASLAVLLFHPSSTIRCFKPNPNPDPTSPQKEKTPLSKPYRSLKRVLSMTKSKRNQDSHTNPSVSRTSSTLSSTTVDPSPPAPPPRLTRRGELFNPVSELIGGRPLTGIVETIFRSGWAEEIGVTVEKVLKVNNSTDVLNRFEEYREMVKSKAKENSVSLRLERLVADGNELLLFHGVVITCSLGSDKGDLSICSKKCCGVCTVIGPNLLVRKETARTTSLCGNSWRAHEKVATECIANGVSPATRKAIILCKVIAGRVVRAHKYGLINGEKGGFDSVVSSTGDQPDGSEELMVLNSKAILPCFVIIYNVCKGTTFQ